MKASVILAYHPTKGDEPFRLKEALNALGIDVILCRLGIDDLRQVLSTLKAKGLTHVVIEPLLLSHGLHFERDVLEALHIENCGEWVYHEMGLYIYVSCPLSNDEFTLSLITRSIVNALSQINDVIDDRRIDVLCNALRDNTSVLTDSLDVFLSVNPNHVVLTGNIEGLLKLRKWGVAALFEKCDFLCEAINHAEAIITTCPKARCVRDNVIYANNIFEALLLLKRAFEKLSR